MASCESEKKSYRYAQDGYGAYLCYKVKSTLIISQWYLWWDLSNLEQAKSAMHHKCLCMSIDMET